MREMKDSGIEWIGAIPQNWELSKVKYVASIVSGMAISKECYEDDGRYEIVGANGTVGYYSKWNNNRGCLTTGRVGTIGTVHKIEKAWVTDNALIIYENENIVQDYLKYVIPNFDFREMTAGTAMPLITATKLYGQFIPMPKFCEQVRIAVYLNSKCSEIDAISADIQKEIETLEQYKRSLVFEAISKGINGEETVNTSSDIWRKIPQSWKLVDIKYLFEIVKRIAGREGYNILSVTQKGLKVKDISGNQGQIAENYSGYQFVFPSDYVMNHMDLLTGWVDCSDQFGVTSPDYRVFRLRDKAQNDTEYYKYVMQCCYMCRIFYSLGQGVSTLGRWRLQTSAFMNFKVPVPPLHEQKEIARYLNDKCKEIELSIDQKNKQFELLSSYKKSLIYEYVTGKKEVPV